MRITMQPELFEGTDTLFRGESTVVKEVDELSAVMAGIAKSVTELPPDKVPASFHDLAATWPARLTALQKKPELIPAKALQQEIRAARWARGLSAEAASQPVLLFPTNPFVEIDYDSLPEPSTVGTPVTLQAMRGEYTRPASMYWRWTPPETCSFRSTISRIRTAPSCPPPLSSRGP